MTIQKINQQTVASREGGPKAVFFGAYPDFSASIIEYLNERQVDLFSAKAWSDVFFGDYFIYIGELEPVKKFVEEIKYTLPKTLLLITDTSDRAKTENLLKRHKELKICCLGKKQALNKAQVEDLFTFFLGSSEQFLNLRDDKTDTTETTTEAVGESHEGKPTEQNLDVSEITLNLSQSHAQIKPQTEKTPVSSIEKTAKPRAKLNPLAIGLTLLFLLLILPAGTAVSAALIGVWELSQLESDLQDGQTESVERRGKAAETSFTTTAAILNYLEPLFSLLHQSANYQAGQKSLSLGKDLSQGLLYLGKTVAPGKTLIKGILGQQKAVAFTAELSQIKYNLELADARLAEAQATLKSEPLSNLFSRLPRVRTAEFKNNLSRLREQIQTAENLTTIAPELLGLYSPRTFLVIFQNNMEARPTGGFIGSYGLLSFDAGVLKNVAVEDIYQADGQLKGHVDPPEPVRLYLNQEHWYMRDSNWDPDFSRSARQLLWFLEKETGVVADGVVAVDTYFAQMILDNLGPVELSDYNITLNKNNLIEVLQNEIEADFFPGSTKKKDYLGTLFRKILDRFTSQAAAIDLTLLNNFQTALTTKSLQFYFTNSKIEDVITQAGWGNQVPPAASCPDPACVYDYLAAVDANLGVNKVNALIERQIQGELTLDDTGKLTQNLTLKFQNPSTTDDKTLGEYKNYLRVFLPESYQIDAVKINDLPLTLDTQILAASESTARIYQVKNSRVVDIYLTVPKKSERSVKIVASRQLNIASNIKYVYQIIKQPGYKKEAVVYKFNLGPNLTLINGSALGQVAGATTLVTGSQITYNTTLVKDTKFELNLIKN